MSFQARHPVPSCAASDAASVALSLSAPFRGARDARGARQPEAGRSQLRVPRYALSSEDAPALPPLPSPLLCALSFVLASGSSLPSSAPAEPSASSVLSASFEPSELSEPSVFSAATVAPVVLAFHTRTRQTFDAVLSSSLSLLPLSMCWYVTMTFPALVLASCSPQSSALSSARMEVYVRASRSMTATELVDFTTKNGPHQAGAVMGVREKQNHGRPS